MDNKRRKNPIFSAVDFRISSLCHCALDQIFYHNLFSAVFFSLTSPKGEMVSKKKRKDLLMKLRHILFSDCLSFLKQRRIFIPKELFEDDS